MCQQHHTTKRSGYKQFTERERYKLEGYLDAGIRIPEIARLLGKAQSSVRREIQKGVVKLKDIEWRDYEKYCADVAQRITEERRQNKGPGLRIGKDHELAKDIEELIIKEKYSPEAAMLALKKNGKRYRSWFCVKTLYNYIHANLFLQVSEKDLTIRKRKKKAGPHRISKKNKTARTIEERPEEANRREEYGHQEMDLVVGGKGSRQALLVFTERKYLGEIIRRVPDKSQESIQAAIDRLEIELGETFRERFKTVTSDNGSEFLNQERLEQSAVHEGKRFIHYYAHPYSSWERGSNENANRLIRRFIPKGADIADYSDEDLARIERWINNYPRRKFGGKSSNEMIA